MNNCYYNTLKQNKLFKIMIRYAKENNTYQNFKRALRIYKPQINNSTKSILSLFRHVHMSEELDIYNMKSTKYIFKLYENEIKKEFDNFLNENKVLKPYYEYANYYFISKNVTIPLKPKNKKELVFNNLSPMAYIMYSFLWEDTQQGHGFWRDIHNKWMDIFPNIIDKLVNNEQ